ncbi:RING-type domain-containing protein [Mycena chlorophos]|uniref:RING-type domain-containing protein n=1 Tax=Mycena chlorophos TaxID=658473 RepID=A0A8H6TKI7_MYCCL|nr:RING-type domain-containing protein [Mycena chlorophos]
MPLPTCSICIEPFTQPVSLPCGHVFCRLCIRKTVESGSSASASGSGPRLLEHLCPSCRTPYSIITIDPELVPPHMRPHVRPSIRPLFLDSSSPATSPVPPLPQATTQPPAASSAAQSPSLAEARAQIAALQLECSVWKRRAEQHATANHGLLSFARAAKDCALRLRSERDSARSRCTLLKRTLAEAVALPEFQSTMLPGSSSSPSTIAAAPHTDPAFLDDIRVHLTTDAADNAADTRHAHACVGMGLGGGAGMPVYLLQAATQPAAQYYDNPADVHASHFGPPLKRRKIEHAEVTASPTGSSGSHTTTTACSRSRSRTPSRSPRRVATPHKATGMASTTSVLPASALETLANVSLGVLS